MPTVKVLEPINTLLDYGQPVRYAKGDILDGDLAVKALAAGWPVEVDVADPVVKEPAKKTAPAPTPPAPAAEKTATPAKRAATKTATPAKVPAAKKASAPAKRAGRRSA